MAKKGKTPLGFIGLGLMGLPMTLKGEAPGRDEPRIHEA